MKKLCLIASLALLASIAVRADDKPKDDTPPHSNRPIPLHVQLVFQTHAGDKNRTRTPYEFTCLANGSPTSLKIGAEVPVAVNKQTKEGEKERVEWQYRTVGTNIHCDAQSLEEGRYRVSLLFEQSSLHTRNPDGPMADVPLFNTWLLSSGDVFRDGQAIQSALGTDPNTGETATLDVTVRLMK